MLAAEERENPATGRAFLWLRLRTYGGEIEAVADPGLTAGIPAVGAVAVGTFWLSGRSGAKRLGGIRGWRKDKRSH